VPEVCAVIQNDVFLCIYVIAFYIKLGLIRRLHSDFA